MFERIFKLTGPSLPRLPERFTLILRALFLAPRKIEEEKFKKNCECPYQIPFHGPKAVSSLCTCTFTFTPPKFQNQLITTF